MSGDLAGDIIAYCSMGRQPTTNPDTFRGDFQDAEVIGRRSLAKCLEVRVVFERISLGFIRLCLGQCLNAVVLHDFSDLTAVVLHDFSDLTGAYLRGLFCIFCFRLHGDFLFWPFCGDFVSELCWGWESFYSQKQSFFVSCLFYFFQQELGFRGVFFVPFLSERPVSWGMGRSPRNSVKKKGATHTHIKETLKSS